MEGSRGLNNPFVSSGAVQSVKNCISFSYIHKTFSLFIKIMEKREDKA